MTKAEKTYKNACMAYEMSKRANGGSPSLKAAMIQARHDCESEWSMKASAGWTS